MTRAWNSIAITMLGAGCMVGEGGELLGSTAGESFEEFRARTYLEPWPGGMYIVDGDTPIADDKALHELWASLEHGALTVNRVGNHDDRWTDGEKRNLTYCISDNFGANKAKIVAAMRQATEGIGWETMADVDFHYLPEHDASCTTQNAAVLFPVRQVTNQPYLARAFFPSSPASAREVLVDASSFSPYLGWPLAHVLGHELGHVLGFRHEHTRPEAAKCFEDSRWRGLTPYDSASIMHYPHCNGSSSDLDWTARDAQGAAALYGAPGGDSGTGPAAGTARSDARTGTLAQGAAHTYGAYAVLPGTTFTATLAGSGDPDLYVRWGAAPTTTHYHCRPYLDGPSEQCTLTVPAGETTAYVMVRGYAAASYTLNVAWTAP
jgi:serine protease